MRSDTKDLHYLCHSERSEESLLPRHSERQGLYVKNLKNFPILY